MEPVVAAMPRRILLAEHAKGRLPAIKAELAGAGHVVFETSNVDQTLDAIYERRPDLIIMAPTSDNPQSQEVRRISELKDSTQITPLLLVTAGPIAPDVLERLGGAVDDHLDSKSLTIEEYRRRIAGVLGRLFTIRKLEDEKMALERQSITDFKTGTYNDRYFHRRLREELNRAQRHQLPLSCVMMDFDNFKQINDNFDHAFGDFVLLAFAKKVRSAIREIDIPARFGGDEFVLLLPNTSQDEAVRIAERIRRIVAGYVFKDDDRQTHITLSIGIAAFDGLESITPEELLRRSDCALLEAKRRGRDRILLHSQISEPSVMESSIPLRRPAPEPEAGASAT